MFVFQGMVYAADVPEETTEQPQTEETTDTEIKEDIPEAASKRVPRLKPKIIQRL